MQVPFSQLLISYFAEVVANLGAFGGLLLGLCRHLTLYFLLSVCVSPDPLGCPLHSPVIVGSPTKISKFNA